MKKFAPGEIVTLPVVRETEFGVFLDAGTGRTGDDILLHRGQQTRPVKPGETITVYLYLDPRHRLTATMRLPTVKEGEVARLEVDDVTSIGAFLDMGTDKGLLLPFTEMKGRPRKGDRILVKVYRDKSGRVAASMHIEDDVQRMARPAEIVRPGDTVTGVVYNLTDAGAFLLTEEGHIALLHKDEMTSRVRIGDDVTARVTFVREDGRLNVSLRPPKEEAIVRDATTILAYLEQRQGCMPYSDDSPPEVIKAKFNISKAAFKRALGKLLKEGRIAQREGWTYLLPAKEETAPTAAREWPRANAHPSRERH